MERPKNGNYSGDILDFTGTITIDAWNRAKNTALKSGGHYIATYGTPSSQMVATSNAQGNPVVPTAVHGVCGSSVNTCIAGDAAFGNAGSCGGTATWTCL